MGAWGMSDSRCFSQCSARGIRAPVVHYLEGIGQRGDPWQGDLPPCPAPGAELVSGPVGSAFNGPKAAGLSGLLLWWLWVCPGEGWGLGCNWAWLQGLVTTLHEGDDFGQLAPQERCTPGSHHHPGRRQLSFSSRGQAGLQPYHHGAAAGGGEWQGHVSGEVGVGQGVGTRRRL